MLTAILASLRTAPVWRCHNGTTAPDKFTPWENSGHAIIMKENIDNPAGHWSATSCGPCHTVGYNQSATAIQNGGWDQVADSRRV